MMKILLSFLVTCVTAVASAGAMSWAAAQIQASPAGAYVRGETKYSAYLYIVAGDVTLDSITGYFAAGDISSASAASVATKISTATDTDTPVMGFGGGAKYGSFSDEVITAFMIITDAATMADASNYLVALSDNKAEMTKTIAEKVDQTYSWGSQASNTAWKEIGAVPEPASMSLLLVGLAGIGLRRKLKKTKKAA